MSGFGVVWSFGNWLLVISNLAFALPAYQCLRAKKYVACFFFVCTGVVSGVYHACKWGPRDETGYGGVCVSNVTFEMAYAMDFFCSHMTIPITVGFFLNPKVAMVNATESLESETTLPDALFSSDRNAVAGLRNVGNRDRFPSERPESWVYARSKTGSVAGRFSESYADRKKLAKIDGVYYVRVKDETKESLYYLELCYILYHVMALAMAIKIAGTSFLYVSAPLVLSNVGIALWYVLFSYLAHKTNVGHAWRSSWINAYASTCCSKCDVPLVKDEFHAVDPAFGVAKTTSRFFYLVLFFVLSGLGLILFFSQEYIEEYHYAWSHSLWHVLMSAGFWVLFDKIL